MEKVQIVNIFRTLQTFLSALKLAHDGEELDKDKISMLAPATIKAVEKPVENLSVLAKKDYPITHGFPSSLKRLEIKSCKLTRVDRRVLNLQHLTYLDLSSNSLRQLPSDFDR
jgi:Leucine-rich repeat (LRR) protein